MAVACEKTVVHVIPVVPYLCISNNIIVFFFFVESLQANSVRQAGVALVGRRRDGVLLYHICCVTGEAWGANILLVLLPLVSRRKVVFWLAGRGQE